MGTWFLAVVFVCISLLFKSIFSLFSSKKPSLPPGPPSYPIISALHWFRRPFSEIEPLLRSLHAKHGPLVSLQIGSVVSIFVSDRKLAHKALVQTGSIFSDRPPALPTGVVTDRYQHNISSAFYGPKWRLLRRNLTSEILHPSRVKSYSAARSWVLNILLARLEHESKEGHGVRLVDHFQYAMFCLLVYMCFGDKVSEDEISQVEKVQRDLLLSLGSGRFNILNFLPRLGRILLRKLWAELRQLRADQEAVLIPLIRARKRILEQQAEMKATGQTDGDSEFVFSYVDSLLELELPDEKRKLTEHEIVSLCSEFLSAGTDTTFTALQWIMANLVKHQHIQETLVQEISEVGGHDGEIKEEELQKLDYLKAIILEGLRRHPPAHFVVPHAVSKDAVLDGYLIPKNGSINFLVADIGWDPEVWKDPMEFKPERFLSDDKSVVEFDVTGSKEILMMPFGAGRRICPGYQLAMLHLEYFVANLVARFRWTADGEVDFAEKLEFTVVMKHPLKAKLEKRT